MEAQQMDDTVTQDPEAQAPTPPEREPSSLFKYSAWVHVGPGADDCPNVDEDAGTCTCADTGHFHAWCRLPNTLQVRDIRERANAAKARKLRQLRAAGTDINDILESELEELAARGEDVKPELVEELLAQEWWRDYTVAMREVRDLDDEGEGAEEGDKLYASIDEDQARYKRLQVQDPDTRNADEYDELTQHLADYNAAVEAQFQALLAPKRASFEAMEIADLLDLVRRERIKLAGKEEFMHHFSIHEWLAGSYRDSSDSSPPRFSDLTHLERAAPEVLLALQTVYADLERSAQEAQGN